MLCRPAAPSVFCDRGSPSTLGSADMGRGLAAMGLWFALLTIRRKMYECGHRTEPNELNLLSFLWSRSWSSSDLVTTIRHQYPLCIDLMPRSLAVDMGCDSLVSELANPPIFSPDSIWCVETMRVAETLT
jgi:hypothetical protein